MCEFAIRNIRIIMFIISEKLVYGKKNSASHAFHGLYILNPQEKIGIKKADKYLIVNKLKNTYAFNK